MGVNGLMESSIKVTGERQTPGEPGPLLLEELLTVRHDCATRLEALGQLGEQASLQLGGWGGCWGGSVSTLIIIVIIILGV